MEDYKKNYEDSMKKIEHLYESVNPECKRIIEYYFPELKESEDERIRKEILSFLKEFEHDHYRNLDFSSWIAWLEKQKEANNKTEIFKKLLELVVKITSFTVAPWFNKESFQIMKEDFGNINETLHLFTIEELKSFFSLLENTRNERTQYIENEKSLQCIECILKRKDEQNPTWSEEDEKYFNVIYKELESYIAIKGYYTPLSCADLSWLKSLKERYTWKPSDEQIKGIKCAIKTLQHQLNVGDKRLNSLYDDLKKLREE